VGAAALVAAAAGCGSSEGGTAGGTIAFAGAECCGDPEQLPLDIWLMDGDGKGSHRLTDHPSSEREPSWSPDASRLVLNSKTGLTVISADGTGRRRLSGPAVHPIWSPDGKQIAFSRDAVGYVMNADGTGVSRLGDGFPSDWSPDGKEIAITGARGDPSILVVGADGKGRRPISRPGEIDNDPDWSPDGKKLAFAGVRGDDVVLVDVYVTNADGTGEQRLTKFPQEEGECFHAGLRGVDWSPDGEWIAFARTYVGCDKLGDIWIVRPDGSDLTRLTTSGFAVDPAWKPS
jgi:TolB protein